MAKGQMRGNRELRKPKQKKPPVQVESSFTEQIKTAATKNNPQGRKYSK